MRMVFSFSVFRLVLAGVALTAGFAAPALVSAQGPYKILNTWKLGGEGGWDYLTADGAAHRLYLTRGMRVDVVDTDSGKIVGTISNLHGVHGVALDDAGKYGYITDRGTTSAVVVFDRGALATVATIPVGDGADGILFEPVTKTVWAFSGKAMSATVIDTSALKAVGTVALPGKPETPVADGKGLIYDNIEDKSEIVKIDVKTKTIP